MLFIKEPCILLTRFPKKELSSAGVFNIDNKKKCFLRTKSAY